jgi:predicted transcriptional regulator
MDRWRIEPPSLSLRGIGKLCLVLIATHGFVYWYTKENALEHFAMAAERAAMEQRKKDDLTIQRLQNELSAARQEADESYELMRKQDEATVKEIEAIQAKMTTCGWALETANAINGDTPKPSKSKPSNLKRRGAK